MEEDITAEMVNGQYNGNSKMDNAIKFTAQQVLQPIQSPSSISTRSIMNQAGAMMIQDLRSFLQSNEQIITVALSKAMALTLNQNPDIQKSGIDALEALQKVMKTLPSYSSDVAQLVNSIVNTETEKFETNFSES